MSKVVLTDLASLVNQNSAISTINNNNAVIEAAFDNTLSRDGTAPNQMNADIDMNSNDLLNVGTINASDFFVTGTDITETIKESQEAAATSETNAAASESEAAAAAAQAVAAASSVTAPKVTIADAEADKPDVDPEYYDVVFYDTNYAPDSGAIYQKVESEPSFGAKLQNSNGTWYQISRSNHIKVSQCDNDIAVALATASALGIRTVEINVNGTFTPPAGLIIPPSVELIGLGSDKTIIDCSGLTSADLAEGLYGVSKKGGGLTDLGSFSAIAAGDMTITLAVDPGDGIIGKIICLDNHNTGSWLPDQNSPNHVGGRDYYYLGQRFRVVSKDGLKLYLDQASLFSFTASTNVKLYVQDSAYGRISGLTVTMNGSAVSGNGVMHVAYGDSMRLEDLRCLDGSYYGLSHEQCYQSFIDGGEFSSGLTLTSGDSYPLMIGNSAHTRGRNFSGTGGHCGMAHGGSDMAGAIQNYDNLWDGLLLSATYGAGSDVHGNSDKTTFRNCTIHNGAMLAGRDCVYENCHTDDGAYPEVLTVGELAGGRMTYIGGSLTMRKANLTSPSHGVIDAQAGASQFAEAILEVKTNVTAPLATFIVQILGESPTYPISHDLDLNLLSVGTLSNLIVLGNYPGTLTASKARLREYGLPSGVGYAGVAPAGSYLSSGWDYPEQHGKDLITTTAANIVAPAAMTLPHAYPVAPQAQYSTGTIVGGEIYVIYDYAAPTSSAIRPAIWRMTNTAFTAGNNQPVLWRTKL